MSNMLREALLEVDWNSNRDAFLNAGEFPERLHASILKVARWAHEIEQIDKGNPALPFVREMQHGGHNVAKCAALALYKPAASAMRSMLECALYYTYFRSHPSELNTLVRDDRYYISKKDVLTFYQKHVKDYSTRQSVLQFSEKLEKWYSETSAIVHGQIPGDWSPSVSLADTTHQLDVIEGVIGHFERCVSLVNDMYLCVLAGEIWAFVSTDAKKAITAGMPATTRQTLLLDKG